MKHLDEFTSRLTRLLLVQSGLCPLGKLTPDDPQTPASVADILKSKRYWSKKEEEWKKYGK